MSKIDSADHDWTAQAAKLLRDFGFQVREQQTVSPSCYYQFRSPRGQLLAGGPHESRAMAFMSACAAQLRVLGHPHAYTCPRRFAA